MTFLTPDYGIIAAAIAIPSLIILYFLKLKRRDLEISTTLLWKKAIQDLQANAPFQKLRRNILLILQLIVLAAALFALAQPEFKAQTAVGTRQIILIDRSASMSSTDGEPEKPEARKSRLEAAKKQAMDLVDALREPGLLEERGDQAMVIAFDTGATTLQNFTSDKTLLKAAIQAIEATDAPSSIEDAFKVAKAYTGTQKFEDMVQEDKGFVPAGPGATIHLFSDGRLPDAERVTTALEDTVVYHAIGSAETANVGIVGLQAQRAFNDPGKLSIFVGLQSTAHEARTVDVQMAIDQTVSRVRSVTIPAATPPQAPTTPPPPPEEAGAPGAGAEPGAGPESGKPVAPPDTKGEWKPAVSGVVFTVDRVEGGVVTVRLMNPSPGGGGEPDALETDDLAYLVFPPAKRLSVALVTEGSLFLTTALEGLDLSKLEIMSPAQYQVRLDQDRLGEHDVVVLDKWLPTVKPREGSGADAPGLPTGRVLALGVVPPPPLGLIDDGAGERALIIDWEREHPALKHAALDLLDLGKSRKVHTAPDSPVQVVAQTPDGPAIVEITDVKTRAIVVPFNPIDSTWPLDPGFVLFLADSLSYLTDSGIVGKTIRPGETLSERLPQGAKDVRLTLPDRDRRDLFPAADGSVNYAITQIGIYTVSWEGAGTPTDEVLEGGRVRRHVAANLLDPQESEIGTRPKLAMGREEVAGQTDASAKLSRKLWPWLLLAALAVIMLEWFVYNRKVHV